MNPIDDVFWCNCGDPGHYLRFQVYEDEPQDLAPLFVTFHYGSGLPFIDRLKIAWRVLFGFDDYRELVISPADAGRMIDMLKSGVAADTEFTR
jgi:hypothetical protein